MPHSIEQLKKKVMRRIYFLFMVRNTAPLAFDGVIVCVIGFVATFFISVKDVLANLSVATANGGFLNFSATAISHTGLPTKVLLLALGLVGFLAARHLRLAVRAARLVYAGSQDKEKRDN